ncbi:MAG: hypothetical protein LAP85_15620 [Acidobacteriia bacterium]|nr:hypothetical protein [Terriglobia bacterium]
MRKLELKPAHKPVQNYHAALRQFEELGVRHESAVRSAFQSLLSHCARQHDWTLVPEWEIRRQRRMPLRVDGALVDDFRLTHGFWEAKDIHDDLRREVRRKFEAGYPRDNILFQTPRRALLYQNDALAIDADLTKPKALIDALALLFSYTAPASPAGRRRCSLTFRLLVCTFQSNDKSGDRASNRRQAQVGGSGTCVRLWLRGRGLRAPAERPRFRDRIPRPAESQC